MRERASRLVVGLVAALVGVGACGGDLAKPPGSPDPAQTDRADEARDSAKTDSIEPQSGAPRGTISVRISGGGALPEVVVLLVENVGCGDLGGDDPPLPTARCERGRQTVRLAQGKGSVDFLQCTAGVRFTAVALASGELAGCAEALELSWEDAEQGVALEAELLLGSDASPSGPRPGPPDLVVETDLFKASGREGRVARVLERLAEPEAVADQLALDRRDDDVRAFVIAHRSQLIQMVDADPSMQQYRAMAAQVASELQAIGTVQLVTTMRVVPDGDRAVDLTVEHAFDHFAVEMASGAIRLFGRPGTAGAAQLRLVDGSRVEIEDHAMDVPWTAIIEGTIADVFGPVTLRQAVGQIIDCAKVRTWAAGIKASMAKTIEAECRAALDDFSLSQLMAASATPDSFEGSGDCRLLGDGRTISTISDGSWVGIGPFQAHRP